MNTLSKLVKGLDPVADAFAGTVYSDIVSLRNYRTCEFIIYKAVGATGTSTITVEACDDTSGSSTSAVEFFYQAITSGDTPGAITKAETTGFTTTAGSSQLYRVWIDSAVLGPSGYEFARLKAVESVDSPVLGGVLIQLSDSKEEAAIPATAIV